jgi:membrane protein implicated in regulation of membrane protease activity
MSYVSNAFRAANPFWVGFAAALFAVAMCAAGVVLIAATVASISSGSVPSYNGGVGKGNSSFTYASVNFAIAAAIIAVPVLWRPIRTSVFGKVTGDQQRDQRVIGARIGILAACLAVAAGGVLTAFLH